jgi:hypothetical protein
MSDETLRRLERALLEGETTEARLAYSRALARAGQLDRALEVLVPGLEDPAIRSEVGRFPAWNQEGADPGATGHVALSPLVVEPALLWSTAKIKARSLVGSSVALVAYDTGLTLLDPATGATGKRLKSDQAASLAPWTSLPVLSGNVLLVPGVGGVTVHDLSTFKRTGVAVEPGFSGLAIGPGALAIVRPRALTLERHPAWAKAPAASWTFDLPDGFEWCPARELRFVANLVLAPAKAGETPELFALDLETGALRWRSSGWGAAPVWLPHHTESSSDNVLESSGGTILADEKTILAHDGRGAWCLLDHEGRTVLADRSGKLVPRALAGDFVLATTDVPGPKATLRRFSTLDRATGKTIAELVTLAGGLSVAVVRDTVFLSGQPEGSKTAGVLAFDRAGRELWRVMPKMGWRMMALVPTPGRLHVLTASGKVLCYGPPAP